MYLELSEYKERLGFDNEEFVNVYFADWTSKELRGVSTFPWLEEAHSHQGGVSLKLQSFGLDDFSHDLVHELGHALGLWHTFKGVEEMFCNDACLETEPSLELGDLCDDTNPTNKNYECAEPSVSQFNCALDNPGSTPFTNFMGYGSNDCVSEFTPQQVARMHCYIDMKHKTWLESKAPSPVPLAPVVRPTPPSDRKQVVRWKRIFCRFLSKQRPV